MLPQRALKEESQYGIQVELRNNDHSLQERLEYKFVPRSCEYYTIEGSDAFSSNTTFDQNIGEKDVTFTLQLVTNENMKGPQQIGRRLQEDAKTLVNGLDKSQDPATPAPPAPEDKNEAQPAPLGKREKDLDTDTPTVT